jgi:hypothetical protein
LPSVKSPDRQALVVGEVPETGESKRAEQRIPRLLVRTHRDRKDGARRQHGGAGAAQQYLVAERPSA